MTEVEHHCTLLALNDRDGTTKYEDLVSKLEGTDVLNKTDALKEIILSTISGQALPKLMMPVIKFCINTRDHVLKKLLLMYWEVVDKTGPKGNLLPEMILVCNALRNDLQHPNEYIRGITLRFLCKVKHVEILDSLIPAIVACLPHRHSYVRKNAVIAIFQIFQSFPHLIPDAPNFIEELLASESNAAVRRNAFLMLFHCDQKRAVRYVASIITQLESMGDSFQMVFLELARKVCRGNPKVRPYYLRAVYFLLESSSNTVCFEAASTLLALSAAPSAVKSAIQTLARLLALESENNVKLIVLNRLVSLLDRHKSVLQGVQIDILRVLSTPNLVIRQKALELSLNLLSKHNVDDMVTFLKKELSKSEHSAEVLANEYRKMLFEAIYSCAVQYPHVASNVVQLLINSLGDEDSNAALDVVYFIREILEDYAELRSSILLKLIASFDEIRSPMVFHAALWILGEFCTDTETMQEALQAIRNSLGELPLSLSLELNEASRDMFDEHPDSPTGTLVSKTVVLADGTYAQQSHIEYKKPVLSLSAPEAISLRSFLLDGEFFLATSIANALTKLSLRATCADPDVINHLSSQTLLAIVSMLRLGEVYHGEKSMDGDTVRRLKQCIHALMFPRPRIVAMFLEDSRNAFSSMLKLRRLNLDKKNVKGEDTVVSHVDALISLRQLRGRAQPGELDLVDDDIDMIRAVGQGSKMDDFASKLDRIYQLTGYSDPVYAECCVTVHEFDIVLDILVINQTSSTLQNLSVELSTSGDLKLVERPQGYTLAGHSYMNIQANIKVSSTESGAIFGNISYDVASSKTKTLVVLNSIHMDIVDFISPAVCSEQEFRVMWAEFEWENKLSVNTEITNLETYVKHLSSITNMHILNSADAGGNRCGFLAANLSTRSVFGEDALLNLSIELVDGCITGHIRIRSKTQGIALSLGDRISSEQRNV